MRAADNCQPGRWASESCTSISIVVASVCASRSSLLRNTISGGNSAGMAPTSSAGIHKCSENSCVGVAFAMAVPYVNSIG
ncbi:hypothetical protein D9M70_526350 [compost metagenome]